MMTQSRRYSAGTPQEDHEEEERWLGYSLHFYESAHELLSRLSRDTIMHNLALVVIVYNLFDIKQAFIWNCIHCPNNEVLTIKRLGQVSFVAYSLKYFLC